MRNVRERLGRRLATVVAVALVVPLLGIAPASAGPPRIYHTISADLGYAVADQTVGCTRTVAFVSSTVAMYAAQPGPVNKQGLTAVLVQVFDVCGTGAAAVGGTLLAEYGGQVSVPLQSDPRLRQASVSARIPDDDRPAISIVVSVVWAGSGPLEHVTSHIHNLFPGEGVVSSTDNGLRRLAEATVSVRVAGQVDLSAPAGEAVLERTKFRCLENPRPGVEEFYPCFGFPG
jgi:hypothetical protein